MRSLPWALERAANRTVLRLRTTVELTRKTIETAPPAPAPPPLDGLLAIPDVRSVGLHRYRARLNLAPRADRAPVEEAARRVLARVWGRPVEAPPQEPPRRFEIAFAGPPGVAESLEMAGSHPVLRALFLVPGVTEAVLERGRVQVRLGKLFAWEQMEPIVREALRPFTPRR